MSRNDLALKRKKLNYIFEKVGRYDSEDGEIDSYLAKYLCILSSGFLEESIRTIYGNYAEGKSNRNVTEYVKKRLRYFQNADYESIMQITYSFSNEWGSNLEKFVTEEMKTSINSIVNNKNLLAHGSNSGITYVSLKNYFENSLKVLDYLETLCNK